MEILSFSFTDDIPDGLIMRKNNEGKIKEKIISVNDFIRSLTKVAQAGLTMNYWLPPNCLNLAYQGDELRVVVTSDAITAPATYHDRTTKEDSGYIIPYPKLLFCLIFNVNSGVLQNAQVFALKDDNAENNPDLYVFPYSNVYTNGNICFGGNVFKLNDERLDLAVSSLIEMFYATPYNGDLYRMSNSGFLSETLKILFEKMNGEKIFPKDKLVPLNQKLTDIIE